MAESRRDEIAKLEALYASNPDGRVFTHLAEAYRRAGELDRAREILDRGLQRHPDYPSAHVVLGRVHADLGSDEEAATAFRRVLELDPENLIARRSLAEAARSAGRDEEALQHYRELLAQDPSASEVREIVDELDARLHGPPAPPPVMPASWSATQDEESWDAPEPAAPQESAYGAFGQVPDTPAAGDIDLSGTFGVEGLERADDSMETPAQPEPSPFDPEPLDLSGVDFGGGAAAPGEATADREAEPVPNSGYDASGWGEWPGGEQEPAEEPDSGTLTSPLGEPGPAPVTGDSDAEPVVPDAEAAADLDTGPVHTEEPEPFAGRPTVEAPLEDDEVRAPEPILEETAADFPAAADEAPAMAESDIPPAVAESAEAPAVAEADEAPAVTESVIPPAPGPEPDWPDVPARAGSRDDFDGYGVPTETLAALYEAQGFADRAAAVYRALLRDRPDDERLRERARAADEAAAAQRAERSGIEETREVWVSGAADSWDAAGQSRTAYAWDDAEEDDDGAAAGPSIGDYLQRVLSWRPTEAATTAELDEPRASGDVQWEVESVAEAPQAEQVEADEPAALWESPEAEPSGVGEPAAPWETADAAQVEAVEPAAPWEAADAEQVEAVEPAAPWESAEAAEAGTDEPAAPWEAPEPVDDDSFAPWDGGAEREDDHDTLGGFVFGGESGGTAEAGETLHPAASEDKAQPADTGLDIEYGYGLAPGESAFGAHPPEEPSQVAADDVDPAAPVDADEEFAAGEPLVFGAESEDDELPYLTPGGDTGLHLDTLLPLPPEDAVPEEQPASPEEPPTTWFEPEPAAADAGPEEVPGGMPFDFAEPDEPVAEALPFAFEDIGTEPESPVAEPLPFDLAALGADIDDEPGEPLPFEMYEPEEPPFAIPEEPFRPEPEPEEAMLELEEAEAVNEAAEAPQPVGEGWDPTVALADVASRPQPPTEPKLRVQGGTRPEPMPPSRPASRPEPEEEEDEDLEMFRSWLQSLKK